MSSSILDSRFLKDLSGTAEMRAVFDDMHLLQKWLDTEVALAQAEAELGIIPTAASEEITRGAVADQLDLVRIKELIDKTVHPIVPVIRVLGRACDGNAGEYIHWASDASAPAAPAPAGVLRSSVDFLRFAAREAVRGGSGYPLWVLGLLVVIGLGIFAYVRQMQGGLITTASYSQVTEPI